jgi:O-6-methylguanine DNA methyltransferase
MAKRLQTPDRSFAARVLAVVRRIPAGCLATYGDVAVLAGAPGAARAVGTVLRGCSDRVTPCHRVVGAGGALGGWTGPMEFKREQLRREGFQVHLTRIQDFEGRRWMPAVAPAGPDRRRQPAAAGKRRASSGRRLTPAPPPTR